jgi:hypothetical protein
MKVLARDGLSCRGSLATWGLGDAEVRLAITLNRVARELAATLPGL